MLARVDVPWPARLEELASLVAGLSEPAPGGEDVREAARGLVEVLVAAAQDGDRGQRAAVAGLVDRAVESHAAACAADPSDGPGLASWLLWLQTGFAEPPEVRLASYAPALGEDGLARYRAEAVARFERLPVIGFGVTGRYDRERWALLRVVEELAEHTGDVDLQVLVLSRDLSSGWHYLRVATVLRDADRSAEAVEWVERGLAATGGRGAAMPLVDLGVDECLRVGWVSRAVVLRRRAFLAHPVLETYRRLRAVASSAGEWSGVREEVLARLAAGDVEVLRQVVAEESASSGGEWAARLREALAGRERG